MNPPLLPAIERFHPVRGRAWVSYPRRTALLAAACLFLLGLFLGAGAAGLVLHHFFFHP